MMSMMMVLMMTGKIVGVRRISGIELGAVCNQQYVGGHVTYESPISFRAHKLS